MQEPELVAELFEEFASEYEADRDRTEYKLSADSRLDIVVMGSNEKPLIEAFEFMKTAAGEAISQVPK